MKYIVIILLCLCSKKSESQVIDSSWITIKTTFTHQDSINKKLVDTIYAHRSNYIGYPMSKLYKDVPKFIKFSEPDNVLLARRGNGTIYYENFILYLPASINDGDYGFIITISSKVYTSVKDYRNRGYAERSIYAKELLKDAVITSIKKNY